MKQQIAEHVKLSEWLAGQTPLLERISDAILDCFQRGGRLYLIGNGGSAADAQHIAAELLGRFKINRPALPAVALTTDTSTLTAVGNDLGGELIFARQVEALVAKNDLLWVLSVSGTSPNIVAAVRAARKNGAGVIGFTSRRGASLTESCAHGLIIPHDSSDRVQEMHELAYHLICERVEARAAREASA